ncbi:unnamed protein product, partial [Ectocarpus sp. 6 AP-2014]
TARASALNVQHLTDEDGSTERYRRLKIGISPRGCPACSMHIPQSAVECVMCG